MLRAAGAKLHVIEPKEKKVDPPIENLPEPVLELQPEEDMDGNTLP
jgi:hypothetical protein